MLTKDFELFGISTTSAASAVQQVRVSCEDKGYTAKVMYNILFDHELKADKPEQVADTEVWQMSVLQAAVTIAIKQPEMRAEHLLEAAIAHAASRVVKPSNRWMYGVATKSTGEPVVSAAPTVSVGEVKVELNANGKIKKGGKGVLAEQIYLEMKAGGAVDNKKLIEQLMTKLDMSKSGATTYAWNLRNKHDPSSIRKKG